MARKAKKSAKRTKTKRTPKKKAPARKAAARKPAPKKSTRVAKTVTKKAAKKPVKHLVKAKAKQAKGEFGEGNYKASKKFDKDQSSFVKANKKKIPAMAKSAKAALEGPQGAELKKAEQEARSHSVAGHEE